MIVVDASTLVSAAFCRGSVPDLAVRRALTTDRIAVSEAVMAEFLDVLYRPRLARYINPELRADLLGQFGAMATFVVPMSVGAVVPYQGASWRRSSPNTPWLPGTLPWCTAKAHCTLR